MANNYLDKVKALLAKAEHEDTPQAEAEACTAKALGLMAKHGIDEAHARHGTREQRVEMRAVDLRNPLARSKGDLLNNVAPHLGVQMVRAQDRPGSGVGKASLFGYSADIDRTILTWTSLMVQMNRLLAETTVPAWESPRRFRNAWRLGFISRVNQRLGQAAQQEATHQAHATGASTALVLRDREKAVWEALREEFPHTKRSRATASSAWGNRAGYAAGSRADLGNRDAVGTRRQIGS